MHRYKKALCVLAAAAVAASSFCMYGCAADEKSTKVTLRVANWEEYIDLGEWDDEELIAEAKQQAEQEIVECKKILRDNPEEYPDYIENQSGYEPVKPFENSNDNPIFLIGGTTR